LGKLAEVILQTHSPKPLPGLITAAAITETLQQISSHLHVLLSSQAAQQVVSLKNHADSAAKQLSLASTGTLKLLPKHAYIALLDLT
jgi:hypothetical protein